MNSNTNNQNYNRENQDRGGRNNPKNTQPNKEGRESKQDAMHVNDDEDMEVEGTERADLGFRRDNRGQDRNDSKQPQQ